jgi:hypothetical protein
VPPHLVGIYTFIEKAKNMTMILPYYAMTRAIKRFALFDLLKSLYSKKWWVESDFKAPNLPLSLWFKGSGCHCNSI